ncbi:hypothetical protein GCM10027028_28690 [Streptomyces sundarbansensis]
MAAGPGDGVWGGGECQFADGRGDLVHAGGSLGGVAGRVRGAVGGARGSGAARDGASRTRGPLVGYFVATT